MINVVGADGRAIAGELHRLERTLIGAIGVFNLNRPLTVAGFSAITVKPERIGKIAIGSGAVAARSVIERHLRSVGRYQIHPQIGEIAVGQRNGQRHIFQCNALADHEGKAQRCQIDNGLVGRNRA